MMPDEKTRLLALLAHEGRWCRDAEARDADGAPVTYGDTTAVAWDVTGALCRLFGWRRACSLFEQMRRHIVGDHRSGGWPKPDPAIDAMRTLQDFNDETSTTFKMLRARIEGMPVWNGTSSETGVLRRR